MKTPKTRELEKELYYFTKGNGLGCYCCFEVCVGEGYGTEFIDYVTMSSKDIFKCYEIKISKNDFYSKAAKTFIGHYNYFVMPDELFQELLNDEWTPEKPKHTIHFYLNDGVGIITYKNNHMKFAKKAKRQELTTAKTSILMHSMVRSMTRYIDKDMENNI